MSSKNPIHILLVEDEPIIAITNKKQLEHKGYHVTHVSTGEDAIQLITSQNLSIDLILMDIDLGDGMDGTQAAQAILSKFDIPVVFLSSHTESSVVDKTEKITSYGYVVKNTGIVVLDASIKMALKLFEAKQESKRYQLAQQETEKQILEEKQFLEHLLMATADGFWIIDKDKRLQMVNQAYCRMSGYSKEELLSMTINDIDAIEDPATTEARIKRILETGSELFETKHRRKDGSLLEVEVSVTFTPFNGGCLICFCRDLSKRAQKR